jgi:hypothetical protein
MVGIAASLAPSKDVLFYKRHESPLQRINSKGFIIEDEKNATCLLSCCFVYPHNNAYLNH